MRTKGWMWVAAGWAVLASPLAAQEYPSLGQEEEIRLAMSAGPTSVGENADVWVMGKDGFWKAVEGTNGFACIVVRSAANRGVLAPHCLNPPAVRTVLPAFLEEGAMQAEGWDADRIASGLKEKWDSGDLPLPEGPAYAYMLSQGQKIGPNLSNFRPHFMLYMPYVTNADIGADPSNRAFPFVGPTENHPLSTVVILMEEFVDPADIVLPGR